MHHLLLPEGACYDREGPQLNTQPRVKREEPTASSLKDPSSSSSLDHFQQKAARFLSPILTELAFKATLNYQWINLARQRQRPLPNSIDLPAPKEVAIVETWEETKELGRGAFGVVTLQRCISNTLPTTSGVDSVGMLRAVKSIPKTDYPDYHRELLALKTFCGSLGSYANNHLYNLRFVTFLGWYESPETIYIIVEYLPHGSLDSYLSHNHTTEDEAKDILHQILDGVAIVHSKGWAHRDLKPANILIETPGPEWRVKVADFGICVPGVLLGGEDAGEVGFKTFIGTPSFMAPEVFRARYEEKARYGNTVDIWSVGAMAYLMLTGQAVDEGYLERCRYGSGQPMLVWPEVVGPWKNWTVSEPARVFVEKCLQADPTRRPQTAQETLMGEWFFGPRDDADAELVPEVEVRDNRQTGYTFNSWKDDGEETGYGVDWRPGQKSAKWKDRTSLHLNAYDSDSSLGDEPYDHGVMRDEAGSEEEETVYKEWTE